MPLSWIVAIVPAAFAIDQLNEYNKTNFALLQNGMQPSGSLTTEQVIDDAQFNRLKTQFSETYTGSQNNGKPFDFRRRLKVAAIWF